LNLCGLHPDVESVAIADLDARVRAKARETTGVSQDYETLEELLDADVDAVGIFTPPWTHAELAIQALQAGKHVLSACPA
jgi:predicted dehydrogenase